MPGRTGRAARDHPREAGEAVVNGKASATAAAVAASLGQAASRAGAPSKQSDDFRRAHGFERLAQVTPYAAELRKALCRREGCVGRRFREDGARPPAARVTRW
jgi:hypothetical protein